MAALESVLAAIEEAKTEARREVLEKLFCEEHVKTIEAVLHLPAGRCFAPNCTHGESVAEKELCATE